MKFTTKPLLVHDGFAAWAEKTNFNECCLFLSVPKKNIPKAVNRNYAKRIVRVHFRRYKNFMLGWNILVQVKNLSGLQSIDMGFVWLVHFLG